MAAPGFTSTTVVTVNVSGTVSQLVHGDKYRGTVFNNGPSDVYIGGPGVTTSNGYRLVPGQFFPGGVGLTPYTAANARYAVLRADIYAVSDSLASVSICKMQEMGT